jgi:predicted TIM-barrel fold metal-dependent hydrolase
MYVCFLRDEAALAALDSIGEDKVMWESDYPHDSTTFPHSGEQLEAMMRDIPEAIALKIVEANARGLFGL